MTMILLFILLISLFKIVLSSADLAVPLENDEVFYKLIVEDKCLERRTDITLELINKRFNINADPTGLDRYPLQVAIDNQSTNCYNLILGIVDEADYSVYSDFRDYRHYQSLLEAKDERGWRAVEHALIYWPKVAFHTLPYHTFINFEPANIKDLIVFAMKKNMFSSIYFMKFVYNKWPVEIRMVARKFMLVTTLEVFLELEDSSSDTAKLYFKEVMYNMKPIDLYNGLDHENQIELKNSILSLYPKAIDRQCISFLSSPYIYYLLKEEFIEHLGEAFDDGLPIVFKALVEAKVDYYKMIGGNELIDQCYAEIREFIAVKFPFLLYSPNVVSPDFYPSEFTFDQAMTVFIDEKFIPNDDLRNIFIENDSDSDSDSKERVKFSQPLYGQIPSFLVSYLVDDEEITIICREDLDYIKRIASYMPTLISNVKFSKKNVKYQTRILKYILSSDCRSPEECKRESARRLTGSFKNNDLLEILDKESNWNILIKSFTKKTTDFREVVNYSLSKGNYLFAYEAAKANRPVLGYDILSKFLNDDDSDNNMEYIFDLLELVEVGNETLESVKLFHDKLLNALYKHGQGQNSKLIASIITRLWKYNRNIDINAKVLVNTGLYDGTPLEPYMSDVEESSVFKILLSIGSETSFKLLQRMVQIFPKGVLKISKEDKNYVNNLSPKYNLYAGIANEYCDKEDESV